MGSGLYISVSWCCSVCCVSWCYSVCVSIGVVVYLLCMLVSSCLLGRREESHLLIERESHVLREESHVL